MAEHYYTQEPTSKHEEHAFTLECAGRALRFETDAGVFSKLRLDPGTALLLKALPESFSGRALDLGCGWGPVGVALGKKYPNAEILMTDVNERAVALAAENCAANGVHNARTRVSDGFADINGAFSAIVLNPPIRAGKAVIYGLFDAARAHLTEDGALYIVIRKQQGAESAQRYLQGIYRDVARIARDKGYWVLRCAGGVLE